MTEKENFDVIIIGAGLAGLTAGAKLAKEGKKILLIEQHSKMGGCATKFRRKNTTLEIGLHEMDGLDRNDDLKRAIFNDLGVYDSIEFVKVPEFFRLINGRVDVTVPHGIENAVIAISKAFPGEEITVETFFQDIIKIHELLKKRDMEGLIQFNTTVGEYLDGITANEDLKFTLTGNLGYYGDDAYTLSMIYFGSAQYSYFKGGGWFIKGGSQVLSDYLASVIEEYGGTTVKRHLVTEILTEDGVAIGVKYKKTPKKHEPDQEEIQEKETFSQIIIANNAIPNVVNKLIPSLDGTDYQKEVNSFEIANSLLSIYLIFSEPPSTLGNRHYSTFILPEELTALKDFNQGEKSFDYTKKGFVFVDYNVFDSQLNEEGKYIGAICAIDYLDNWNKLTDEEYNARKEEVADTLIKRLDAVIPGIKGIVKFKEVATPKTIARYTLNPKGSVYGFSQIPNQVGPFRARIINPPVKNLYFASAWMSGGGFSGAIIGGYICASQVLKNHPI
ncbi:MAG: phytoene desaturase family protein [Candidatus Odinarchaeota archaeon]